jgi:putative PEP-CTERM system TPR-repeat lipoprotein
MNALAPVLDGIGKDSHMLAVAGETYMLNGNPGRAAEYFSRASALDPADHSKRTALAVSLIAKGQPEKGLRLLQEAAAQDSDDRADLMLISTYIRRGEYKKALEAVDVLERKQPESAIPHFLRGNVLLAAADRTSARRSFERALENDSNYFPAIANLARLDILEKQPQLAQARFEAVLRKSPTHRDALLALAEVRYSRRAPAEEVAGLLTKAVSAHPNDPASRIALVRHYMRAREPKKAVTAAQDAVAALPNRADIVELAGLAYQAAGEANQALTMYRKLSSMQPKSAQPHVRMAEAQLAAGDRAAAMDSLQKALTIQPNLLSAQQRLMVLNAAAGKFEHALAVAHQVQKQRPKQSVGFVMEGDLHAAGRKWNDAAAAYRRGLKETSSTDLARRLHDVLLSSSDADGAKHFVANWLKEHPKDDAFRLHVAERASLRRDYAFAATTYRKLLETQPQNPFVLNNLAWASAQLNEPNAIQYAEQAYQLAPEHPAILDTLGLLLLEKGDVARAVELLKRASTLLPQSPDLRLNLAKALLKAGQKDAAKKELADLAKLGEKFPRHAEVKQLRQGL